MARLVSGGQGLRAGVCHDGSANRHLVGAGGYMFFIICMVLLGLLASYLLTRNKGLRPDAISTELQGIFDDLAPSQADSTSRVFLNGLKTNPDLMKDLQKAARRWHKLRMDEKFGGKDMENVAMDPQERAALENMDLACSKFVPLLQKSWPPNLEWPLDDYEKREQGRLMAHILTRAATH